MRAAFVPLFVLTGLLLGPAAVSAAATAPTVRQAPVTVALPQGGLSTGAGAVTAVQAPKSAPVLATTGNKKAKKSKKKGGFFKKLLIVVIIVIVLLVVVYGVRRALRRRSS
ncbi:hypothetical protein [Streptomyces sp. NPDC060333]|uniref:hypothetical protein n=1 Tax=Streptomyces sp. NPDC060333 TaxID=3347098 RepID=UPI0036634065